MKFICKKTDLSASVGNVQRAVTSKSSLPALEGILMRAKAGELVMSGYDLELGITTKIPAVIEKEGAIILNARLFNDIVRRLPDENVSVEVDEKLMATIKSGSSEFSIVGIHADEYPEFPAVSDGETVELPENLIKSMINQTIFAVAVTDEKPVLKGVLFDIEKDSIKLIAVDGYRLALRSEKILNEKTINFVVPSKTLSEVVKLLNDTEEMITISAGKRHIIFMIGDYFIVSRLLDGEFLDYKTAISSSRNTVVKINTRSLIDSVERLSLLIPPQLKSPVRCIFSDNMLKASCATAMGKAYDQLPCLVTGDRVEIGFNNRYLLEALRATECDEIHIELNGALLPMKIVPTNGDNFLFLVLPVRLKNEA